MDVVVDCSDSIVSIAVVVDCRCCRFRTLLLEGLEESSIGRVRGSNVVVGYWTLLLIVPIYDAVPVDCSKRIIVADIVVDCSDSHSRCCDTKYKKWC